MPHMEEDHHADLFELLDLFHSFAFVFDFFLQFLTIDKVNKCTDRGRVQCQLEGELKKLFQNLQ